MANHWHARSRYVTEEIVQRVGRHHSTVGRTVNKHRLTDDVKDRDQEGPVLHPDERAMPLDG